MWRQKIINCLFFYLFRTYERIPLPFPTIPITPPSFVSPDFSQRFNAAGLPSSKSSPNLFPLGINHHPNATQYHSAPSPKQHRFHAGAPSATFLVPAMSGVAPPLFTSKSSHNHSRYLQHDHAHGFTKEVSFWIEMIL